MGALIADSTYHPIPGHAYLQYPNSSKNDGGVTICYHKDAMFMQVQEGVTASNPSEFRKADVNASTSVDAAFNLAAMVYRLIPTGQDGMTDVSPRAMSFYATVDKNRMQGASVLDGSSLGIAFVLAFLGFRLGRKNVVFTGFVQSFGFSPYDPETHTLIDPMKMTVQPIDCAGEKVEGCKKAGVSIFVPKANEQDVKHHMATVPTPLPSMMRHNTPYSYTNSYPKVYFVSTVEDIIRILAREGIFSKPLHTRGYYDRYGITTPSNMDQE